jgi:ADP-heptose:LPS heptosyltransferase
MITSYRTLREVTKNICDLCFNFNNLFKRLCICNFLVTEKVALYKHSRAKLQSYKFQNFSRVIIFEIAEGVL